MLKFPNSEILTCDPLNQVFPSMKCFIFKIANIADLGKML